MTRHRRLRGVRTRRGAAARASAREPRARPSATLASARAPARTLHARVPAGSRRDLLRRLEPYVHLAPRRRIRRLVREAGALVVREAPRVRLVEREHRVVHVVSLGHEAGTRHCRAPARARAQGRARARRSLASARTARARSARGARETGGTRARTELERLRCRSHRCLPLAAPRHAALSVPSARSPPVSSTAAHGAARPRWATPSPGTVQK